MAQKKKKAAPAKVEAAVTTKQPHSHVTIPSIDEAINAIDEVSQYSPDKPHWICFCGSPDCGVGPFTKRYYGKVNKLHPNTITANKEAQRKCKCGDWGPPGISNKDDFHRKDGSEQDWNDWQNAKKKTEGEW